MQDADPIDPALEAAAGAASPVDASPADHDPRLVAPARHGAPRVWSALVLTLATIGFAMIVAGVTLVVGLFIFTDVGFDVFAPEKTDTMQRRLEEFVATGPGFTIGLMIPQAIFLLAAVAAASLSPRSVAERLRLVRPRSSAASWAVWIVATPFCGLVGSLLMSLIFSETSSQLEMLEHVFRSSAGANAAAMIVAVSLVPGLCEELLFRGYLQSRLLERWSPWAAIAVSALIFSAAHVDPAHIVAVFPLGVWLGVLAWRTGSVWPAVVAHVANNMFGVIWIRLSPTSASVGEWDASSFALLAISGTAFLISLVLLVRTRPVGPVREIETHLTEPTPLVLAELAPEPTRPAEPPRE